MGGKRLTAILAVLCVAGLCISGCGSGKPTQSEAESKEENSGTMRTTAGTAASGAASQTESSPSSQPTASPEKEAVTVYGEHTVPLGKLAGTVKIGGRTAADGDGLIFEWTASGFELTGELEGDVKAAINFVQGDQSCFLRVQIDGRDIASPLKLDKGSKTYTLAAGLTKGKHTVKVSKMTEAFMNSITIGDLSFTGKLEAVPAADRKIEFIGDSITAGLDLLIEGAPEGDIGPYEDGTRTYAALTAEALGADYHVFACAGWGFLGGAGGAAQKIPNIYEQITFQRKSNLHWDFSTWQPDVVVVNLGTNDGGFMWQNKLTDLDFEKGMRDFIAQIRKKNPKAEIIWAYGMLGAGMKPLMLNAIEDMQAADKKVHFVELPNTVRPAGSHPGPEDSEAASKVLLKAIKDITGWT